MSIKRTIGITYNTIQDMVNDTSLKSGLVVTTLGYNKINDGKGGTYILRNNDEVKISDTRIEIPGKTCHAEEIDSSNYGNIIADMNVSIDMINQEMELMDTEITQTRDSIEKMNTDITSLTETSNDAKNCVSTDEIDALDIAGVKIIRLANGQKCVIVDDIDATQVPPENVTETYDASTTTATVVIPVDGNEWVLPVTLQLMNFKSTTMTLNEKCSVSYNEEESQLTFTVNRNLNPAVHYYM